MKNLILGYMLGMGVCLFIVYTIDNTTIAFLTYVLIGLPLQFLFDKIMMIGE